MSFRVVPIEGRHIDSAIELHLKAFPDFFLTFLGPRFLRELYRSLLNNPVAFGLVAEDDQTGRLVGLVCGTTAPSGYYAGLLKRRWWAFCLASVWAVSRRPAAAKRLFRALFFRGDPPSGPPRSLLTEIGVDPDTRGHGLGRALTKAWLAEVRRRGSTGCYMVTDADNNDGVNRFYQRTGWTLEATYMTPEGRALNRYVMDFAKDPGALVNDQSRQ